MVSYVPVSGLNGDNLTKISIHSPWYTACDSMGFALNEAGKTLLEMIDNVKISNKRAKTPLRISINKIYHTPESGTVVVGCILSGVIRSDTTLKFASIDETSAVSSLKALDQTIESGSPGQIVEFSVDIDSQDLECGYIAGDADDNPPIQTKSFNARIRTYSDLSLKPIKVGQTIMVDRGASHVPCRFDKLIELIDINIAHGADKSSKKVRGDETAIIKLVPLKPMCVETFKESPLFGKICIRDASKYIASGVVLSVEKED